VLHRDFKEFLELLNEHKVKYLVVGGFALNLYVPKPRSTGDIDIWVKRSLPNSKKIKVVVEIFCNETNINSSVFLDKNLRAPIGEPPFCIDILMDIKGLDFDEANKNKKVVEWKGLKIPFLSKEDLIKTKRAVGRLQDKADLAALGVRKKR